MLSREQIAELRREIEAIEELNTIYRAKKNHGYRDREEHERRKVRLEEIKQQLLHSTRGTPGSD